MPYTKSLSEPTCKIVGLIGVIACVLSVVSCGPSRVDTGAASRRIVVAAGDDRLPSRTASDWVTYADYVAVVTPIAEQIPSLTREEIDRGEGAVIRDLTLRVDEILWSNPKTAALKPDSSIRYPGYGFAYFNGNLDEGVPMIGEDESRLELSHTYIMALSWAEARCTPGDFVPEGWRGLGSDGIIPFDNGIIGNGEFQAETMTSESYAAQFPDVSKEPTIGPSLAGMSDEALVHVLNAAELEQKGDFLPPPAPCS